MDSVYVEGQWSVTPERQESFREKGFIIVRNLFNAEELQRMEKNVDQGAEYQKFLYLIDDKDGNQSTQVTWNQPGSDVLGMAASCEKIVGTCAKLLGGEVYHYHSKICSKGPKTGGKRAWHQDYGYWYNNGCLFPDMMTVFVPMVKTTQENGCLQVLEGSHKAGRIEHKFAAGEQGADLERVEQLMAQLPLVHVEMGAGDALFFHCNLLHTSGTNTSDQRRMAFLPAYNMAANNPVIESHHPRYTPLKVVPNSAILECTNFSDLSGKDFLEMEKLKTLEDQINAEKVVNDSN